MNFFPSFTTAGFPAQPNSNLLLTSLFGRSSLGSTAQDLLSLLNPQLQLLNHANALAQLSATGDDDVILMDPVKKVKTTSNAMNNIGGFSAQENSNPQPFENGIGQNDSRGSRTRAEKQFSNSGYPETTATVKLEPSKKNGASNDGLQRKEAADIDSDVSTATDLSSRVEKKSAEPLIVSEGLTLGLGSTPLGFSSQNQVNPLLALQSDLLIPRQDINELQKQLQLLLTQQQILSVNPLAVLSNPMLMLEFTNMNNQIKKIQSDIMTQQYLQKFSQFTPINNLIQTANQSNAEIQPPIQNDPDLIILDETNDKVQSKKKLGSNISNFSNVTPNQGVKVEEKGPIITRLKQKGRIEEEPQADNSISKPRQTRNMARTNKEKEEEKILSTENENKKVGKIKQKQQEKDSKRLDDALSIESDNSSNQAEGKVSPNNQLKEKRSKVIPELTPPLKPMKRERKMNRLQEMRAIEEERVKEFENYVIKIHFDDKKKDNIVDTRRGDGYQTKLHEFDLNYKLPVRRQVRKVWTPESSNESELNDYFKLLTEKNQEEVTNQERALKLLKKFDMDKEKVLDNITKNPLYYKNYFDIHGYQSILRQRKDTN